MLNFLGRGLSLKSAEKYTFAHVGRKKLQVHQVTKSVIIKSARRTAAAAAAEGRSHST